MLRCEREPRGEESFHRDVAGRNEHLFRPKAFGYRSGWARYLLEEQMNPRSVARGAAAQLQAANSRAMVARERAEILEGEDRVTQDRVYVFGALEADIETWRFRQCDRACQVERQFPQKIKLATVRGPMTARGISFLPYRTSCLTGMSCSNSTLISSADSVAQCSR